jgi:hypothetical protein
VIIVLPTDTPETTPDEPTVAIAVLAELHVPPGEAHANESVPPVQAFTEPIIAAGVVEIVTTTLLEHPVFV